MTIVGLRRTSRRLGALLVLLAFAAGLTIATAGPSGAQVEDEVLQLGASTYGRACALCHGENGRGLDQEGASGGPSLIGVGAASVDFYLRTGRMPLQDQNDRVVRREPQFPEPVIEALVALIPTFGDEEGPEIPDVDGLEDADLSRGLELYTSNCAACHGPTAAGIAVGQREISSALDVASPVEIAEAIRIGPGVMPRFSDEVVTSEDLAAITAWVVDLRDRATPGGATVGRTGPVGEGLVAWVVGLGLLGIVMYLLGDKSKGDEILAAEAGLVTEGADDGDA